MLFVSCCLWFVACWSLVVVCCVPFRCVVIIVYGLWLVVIMFDVRCLVFVVYCLLIVDCCSLVDVCVGC